MGLDKDLEELINFFNFHKKTKESFADKIHFETGSNSYVRILKENIEKQNFPAYDVNCVIDEIVNSDSEVFRTYRKYILTVNFERIL